MWQPSIQAAVDAATEGDIVLLSDGWFRGSGNRDVVVAGKNLTIESRNGPQSCIIDCERKGRAFAFTGSAIDSRTVLRGVTITRGQTTGFGGALWVDSCSPTIEFCAITKSKAGIGGAVHYTGRALPGRIQDCRFFGNEAGSGGALRGSNLEVVRCEITGNKATGNGGGVSFSTPSAVIRNSVISGNTGFGGGGLGMIGEVEIDHCTFADNFAVQGGALYKFDPSATHIRNSILWGNQTTGGGGQQAYLTGFGPANTVFLYCDIEGGASGVEWTPGSDPQFSFLLAEDPVFATASGFRLSRASGLIGAGDPAFMPDINEGDVDLQPRVAGGRVDIGADEFWSGLTQTLVMPGVTGANNRTEVSGAVPGELIFFFASLARGSTSYAFAACPSLAFDLATPQFLGMAQVSAAGRASYSQFVSSVLGGVTIYMQSVGFDPTNPAAGCSVGNVVGFQYP